MQLADLPHAAFLDVGVLVLADAPDAVGARLREHDHALPAPGRGLAVGRDGDDRLQQHVVVEIAAAEPFGAEQQHRAADPLASDVDAHLAVLEGAVGGKQVGRLAPQALVEVIAVGRLQLLDRLDVLEPFDPLAIGGEPRLGRLLGEGGDGNEAQDERHGQCDRAHHRAPLTGRPVTGFGCWNGGTCTSGNGAGVEVGGRSGGKALEASLRTSPSPGASRAQPRS